ncbi:uncharacterized protein PG986_002611 [Apiospora aurea]|uniref:Rieske domain-containing protein n=1 Tax=Apiospora aurea TaxID=335848 RepID=A0ABR1QPD4_9PEZI
MSTNFTLLLSRAYEPVQLLLVLSVVLACVACSAWILASTRMHRAWHKVRTEKESIRAGLNAAEKGTSSVAIRAEHIPYDLEKRAILHRRWMMVAHESHFPAPGAYRTYTIADLPFLVIRGPDGTLRAFHNVCRHRAYAVARKPCGSSLRLACKYHGWQYDAAGRLVKAPQFADKPSFDLGANGLFRIHLRIDSGRFVFVNLATELADAFPWTDISSPSLRTLDFGQQGAGQWGGSAGSLLPWFLDGTRLMNCPWPKKTLSYLLSTNRLHLQYVDDASFICDLGAGDFLLISAVPLTGNKSIAKCTYLPWTASTSGDLSAKASSLEALVRVELSAAVSALKHHRMATTALDFQQSAVRERLDKFSRHVHQHQRAETQAGRKLNPALRCPTPAAGPGSGSGPDSGAGSRTTPATTTTNRSTTTITTTTTTGSNHNFPIGTAGEHSSSATAPGSSQPKQQQKQQQRLSYVSDAGALDGDAAADLEAEAIGHMLDGLGDGATTSGWCPQLAGERSAELEW